VLITIGIFAALVLGLVVLAWWRAALPIGTLVVASLTGVILTLALFSEQTRIVWADVLGLAFIGSTVAASLLLQKLSYRQTR
jgi:hypothetical protein